MGEIYEEHPDAGGIYDMDAADDSVPPARAEPRQSRIASNSAVDPNDPATWGRVPRNSACPCGSGKKFKHCHGSFG